MLQLIQTDLGQFDIAAADYANQSGEQTAVRTLVYALLFTDAQAADGRAQDYDQRGWWANTSAGSGLWHVRRRPLSDDARRETIGIVTRTLSREPALADINVTDVSVAGSVSRLHLAITGVHNGKQFAMDITLI